ncbi:hypothetical protein ON010_g10899 [Phytophthora cinnamomi]|nr:hypothetical protein ON010_g10899 [Phytophthora cinnamomi]
MLLARLIARREEPLHQNQPARAVNRGDTEARHGVVVGEHVDDREQQEGDPNGARRRVDGVGEVHAEHESEELDGRLLRALLGGAVGHVVPLGEVRHERRARGARGHAAHGFAHAGDAQHLGDERREVGRHHVQRESHVVDDVGEQAPAFDVHVELGPHQVGEGEPADHARAIAQHPLQRGGQRRGLVVAHAHALQHALRGQPEASCLRLERLEPANATAVKSTGQIILGDVQEHGFQAAVAEELAKQVASALKQVEGKNKKVIRRIGKSGDLERSDEAGVISPVELARIALFCHRRGMPITADLAGKLLKLHQHLPVMISNELAFVKRSLEEGLGVVSAPGSRVGSIPTRVTKTKKTAPKPKRAAPAFALKPSSRRPRSKSYEAAVRAATDARWGAVLEPLATDKE